MLLARKHRLHCTSTPKDLPGFIAPSRPQHQRPPKHVVLLTLFHEYGAAHADHRSGPGGGFRNDDAAGTRTSTRTRTLPVGCPRGQCWLLVRQYALLSSVLRLRVRWLHVRGGALRADGSRLPQPDCMRQEGSSRHRPERKHGHVCRRKSRCSLQYTCNVGDAVSDLPCRLARSPRGLRFALP